jgi:hypothetical protein
MSTNKIVSAVFMLFSLAMFASTFAIEEHSFVQGLSARFWPQAVLVFLFGLSLSLFFAKKEEEGGEAKPSLRQILVCCLYFTGYIVGLQITGYVIATLLFQVLFLLYMDIRSRKALVLIPVITTGAMLAAFKGLLNVLLPAGLWFFQTFNNAVWN